MSKDNKDQLNPRAYSQLRGCSPALCRCLIDRLAITAHDHVLDIGCGPGENTALLGGMSQACVEGLDLDTERITFANRMFPAMNFHQGNAEHLPFEDGSYSIVTMMLSVQRFRNRDKVLSEVNRILKPGGRLGIATVSPEQLATRPDFRVFPTALRLECERFPKIGALRESLHQCGFTNIGDLPFSEVIRPIDDTFLRWLKNFPFTVLKKIPEEEFQAGLRAIDQSIHNSQSVLLLKDEYTIITSVKI